MRKIEANRSEDAAAVLIAVSPGETNEQALARSGKDKASIEGQKVYFIRTGVPRPDCGVG